MNKFEIDKREVRRAFSKAATSYDAAAVLQREVCIRMLEKLDIIKFYVFKLFKPNTYVSPFAVRNILKAVVIPCVAYGIALWKYDRLFSQQLDRYITTILRMTVRGPSRTVMMHYTWNFIC